MQRPGTPISSPRSRPENAPGNGTHRVWIAWSRATRAGRIESEFFFNGFLHAQNFSPVDAILLPPGARVDGVPRVRKKEMTKKMLAILLFVC